MAYIPVREIVMVGAAALSYFTTQRQIRFGKNEFTWGPIQEVAALFIGIFLTMMPALEYLARVAPSLPLNKVTFFIFGGGLSAVLDNAPTYVTFFEMAAQLPGEPRIGGIPGIPGVPESYLIAISLGSVFCGAITYIGNGPNFMVKAVAEKGGVPMPSFGGYMVWTFRYLVPILVGMVMIFIVGGLMWSAIGLVISVISIAATAMVGRGAGSQAVRT